MDASLSYAKTSDPLGATGGTPRVYSSSPGHLAALVEQWMGRGRRRALPVTLGQTRPPARPATQLRQDLAASWRRHLRHRTLARTAGVRSTDPYLHADISIKEKGLAASRERQRQAA
jgi:hypothetical protein